MNVNTAMPALHFFMHLFFKISKNVEHGQNFKNMLRTYTRLRCIQNFISVSTCTVLNALVYVVHKKGLEDVKFVHYIVLQFLASH